MGAILFLFVCVNQSSFPPTACSCRHLYILSDTSHVPVHNILYSCMSGESRALVFFFAFPSGEVSSSPSLTEAVNDEDINFALSTIGVNQEGSVSLFSTISTTWYCFWLSTRPLAFRASAVVFAVESFLTSLVNLYPQNLVSFNFIIFVQC